MTSTNSTPVVNRVNGINITSGEYFREITYNPENPEFAPHSLGRNGYMLTTGMVLEITNPTLRISPINSKNKVGRSSVSIPMDKNHLLALRSAIDSIIQERFPEPKPAQTAYLNEGTGLSGRVIRVVEILLNYGCITEEFLFEITDNMVFDYIGTSKQVSDTINNAGYETQIVALGEKDALMELIHHLAEKIRVPSQELNELITDDDFQPLSVLGLMDKHPKPKVAKAKA